MCNRTLIGPPVRRGVGTEAPHRQLLIGTIGDVYLRNPVSGYMYPYLPIVGRAVYALRITAPAAESPGRRTVIRQVSLPSRVPAPLGPTPLSKQIHSSFFLVPGSY